jgi:hypothetical protein
VDPDQFPLSAFEADCDGSACGSGNCGWHVHPPQDGQPAISRVTVREGRRAGRRAVCAPATGITRLVTL